MKNSSSRKALFPAFKKLFNSLKVYPVCMYLGEVYQGVTDIILVHSIEKIQLIFLSKEPDKCFYYFYVSYGKNTDDTLQYFCSREEGAEERDERNQAERFPDASLAISKLTS